MGLLLLRLVGAIAAIVYDLMKFEAGLSIGGIALGLLRIITGVLLLTGLWTPVSGSLLAVVGLWELLSKQSTDPWATILLITIGAALALLGPGAWSLDAWIFGWKRIDLGKPRG